MYSLATEFNYPHYNFLSEKIYFIFDYNNLFLSFRLELFSLARVQQHRFFLLGEGATSSLSAPFLSVSSSAIHGCYVHMLVPP
jgi:hypothetical protein